MPSKSTQEKLSMEPILQDVSVSSVTDIHPDVSSDSSRMMKVSDNEVEVASISCPTISSASYPADSTIMEHVQNNSQGPLFKKPFNVKHKRKTRPSLFDSDMKDSEPDTPEQHVRRPFQRKKKGRFKANKLENESFLNVTNENMDLTNCSQNLSRSRKNNTIEFTLGDKDITSESDNSLSKGPVFQRQRNHVNSISSVFDDVFEQSSDSSLINTISVGHENSEKCHVKNQGAFNHLSRNSKRKVVQPNDATPGNINFITRRKARPKKQDEMRKSNIFDKDILTSESDESFTSKPAFKRHTVVKEMKKSIVFDDALEVSINHNSLKKSPTPKRPPFKTSKRTHVNSLPLFDSPLNESQNKSENKRSISHGIFPKKSVKEKAEDLVNFDDVVNNTCDGSSLMTNSLMLKDTLHDDITTASISSPQSALNAQMELDVSNKIDAFTINRPKELSNIEINNTREMAVLLVNRSPNLSSVSDLQETHIHIEGYSVKSPLEFTQEFFEVETAKKDNNSSITILEDQDKCEQLSGYDKDHRSESKNTPSKLNLMEGVNSGLDNYAESKSSQIPPTKNYDTNLSFIDQVDQNVTLYENYLKHSLQSNDLVKELTKDNDTSGTMFIENKSDDISNHDINVETSDNKSILKRNRMTLNGTENDHEKCHVQEGESFNSESRYCKYNKNSDNFSKSTEENNKSLTSLCKIKHHNVKRVSFKLRNEGDKGPTDRNSAFNNTYLEEKSHSRCNQSQISNASYSLESLVLDGSSEITSGSIFIDLCASRNKSSSGNMNLEGNGCEADHVNDNSKLVELHCTEVVESKEEEMNKEMDDDSLEDSDDRLEAGLDEYEKETVELETVGDESGETARDNDENEHKVMVEQVILGSKKDRSVHFNETCTITDFETDGLVEDDENSNLDTEINRLKNTNNLPVNIYNYQFKKPGSCTVLNEQISTPPSKRKVQEMLTKIPFSEFKHKKSKPVSIDLTKEQMEQDKIEERLRKRQKPRVVLTTKTPKLTKPKFMNSKVYDFIIEKITPSFNIKSRVQAESVVIFLNAQVDVIMGKGKENQIVQCIQEMKIKLARLKVIRTHWDFYKFIMNYFDGSFTQKVYPSGVVSPFEPDDPFQNIICD